MVKMREVEALKALGAPRVEAEGLEAELAEKTAREWGRGQQILTQRREDLGETQRQNGAKRRGGPNPDALKQQWSVKLWLTPLSQFL
jgi:hypothetical protein